MKKIITLLVFLVMSGSVFAQSGTIVTLGVDHVIADSYLSAADSIHYIGDVNLRRGDTHADSMQIVCETADSLNIRYYVVPNQELATASVADSVAGCGFVTNVATGGYQFTTDGVATVPWHNIVAALTQTKAAFKKFKIYARVYVVGSEVASSGKKFRTTVKVFE